MNYWKTIAVGALLFPAVAASEKMVGTIDDVNLALGGEVVGIGGEGGVVGINERQVASGWERIEAPRDPRNPNTPIIRTRIDRTTLENAPEHAHGLHGFL